MNEVLAQMDWLVNRFGEKKEVAQTTMVEMPVRHPQRKWRFILCDVPHDLYFYEWSLDRSTVETVVCYSSFTGDRYHVHNSRQFDASRRVELRGIQIFVRALQLRCRRRRLCRSLPLPARARNVTVAYSGFAQLAFTPARGIYVV